MNRYEKYNFPILFAIVSSSIEYPKVPYNIERFIIDYPDDCKNPTCCNITHNNNTITIESSDNRQIKIEYAYDLSMINIYLKVSYINNNDVVIFMVEIDDDTIKKYKSISNSELKEIYEEDLSKHNVYFCIYNTNPSDINNFNNLFTEEELLMIKDKITKTIFDIQRDKLYQELVEGRANHSGFIN